MDIHMFDDYLDYDNSSHETIYKPILSSRLAYIQENIYEKYSHESVIAVL